MKIAAPLIQIGTSHHQGRWQKNFQGMPTEKRLKNSKKYRK